MAIGQDSFYYYSSHKPLPLIFIQGPMHLLSEYFGKIGIFSQVVKYEKNSDNHYLIQLCNEILNRQ